MAKIINFCKAKQKEPSSSVSKKTDDEGFWDSVLPPLLEWNDFLLDILYQWPCFSHPTTPTSLDDLLSKYCEHNLSLSQECVIDLILHIHDPSYIFDLTLSLKTWCEKDRKFFVFFLEKYAYLLIEDKT